MDVFRKKNANQMKAYRPVKGDEAEVFHATVPVVTYLPDAFALRQHYVDYYESFRRHAQTQVKRIDGDHYNASYLDAEILAKTAQQMEHFQQQMATKTDLVRRGIERKLIEDRKHLMERIEEAEAEFAENEKQISELRAILRKGTVYEKISGGTS